jgi:hypothetical protein
MAEAGIEAIAGTPPPERYFASRGLRGSSWSVGPGTWFPEHRHDRTKHLFVTRGSISFNGREVSAPAGIRIGAGVVHEALAGPAGVDCAAACAGAGSGGSGRPRRSRGLVDSVSFAAMEMLPPTAPA